ncbi:MAG TPA: aspartyl protease family protein [Povalibacter sp.]|nr:aspartyl protease family protein [Povalibacter sp.]
MIAGARTAVPRVPRPQRRAHHAIELSSLAVALTFLGGTSSGSPGDAVNTQPAATPQISEQALEPLFAAPTRLDQIGRILAPVIINGQGPFRLIVDTGANQSVLTTKLATALGLEISPEHTVKLHGVTGSVLVPIVAVDRFETGDLVQLGLELPVMNSVMGGAEGILGMQGFAGKRITVDFVHDRISIEDSRGQRAPRDFITVPATLRFNRLLLVNGEVDGIPVRAVIDTGAQQTLGNRALRDALLRRGRFGLRGSSTQVIGLTEEEQRGDVIHTPPIRLGGAQISNIYVVYGDIRVFELWGLKRQPALLVGMDVLGTLQTLVIDYRLKQLQILAHDPD